MASSLLSSIRPSRKAYQQQSFAVQYFGAPTTQATSRDPYLLNLQSSNQPFVIMPIRPISIRQIPTNLIRPLQGVPTSTSLYKRRPEPAKVLLAMGSDLPPNIRVQDWIHDDRQRWSGIGRADRDGVYDKRTKRWVRKGLKTLLREY